MKYGLLLTLMLSIITPNSVAAQKPEEDGPVGIFQSRSEYDEFMGNAKRIAYGENGNSELRQMIPLLNDIVLNRPVGWTNSQYGGEAGTLDVLADPKVREELQMVDEQYEQLQKMQDQIQKRAAEQVRQLDLSDTENLIDQIQMIRDKAEDDLNSVLLPHQVDRLRQIHMQSALRHRSLVDILTSDPVKSKLEVTNQQVEELRQTEKEIEEDILKEIAKLRKAARERLLSKLDSDQKKQVEEMIGDSFEFSERAKNSDRSKGKSKRQSKRQQSK